MSLRSTLLIACLTGFVALMMGLQISVGDNVSLNLASM